MIASRQLLLHLDRAAARSAVAEAASVVARARDEAVAQRAMVSVWFDTRVGRAGAAHAWHSDLARRAGTRARSDALHQPRLAHLRRARTRLRRLEPHAGGAPRTRGRDARRVSAGQGALLNATESVRRDGAEVVSRHRDARDRLPDHALDRAHHRDLVGRHEGVRVALPSPRAPCGRCGARSPRPAAARRS